MIMADYYTDFSAILDVGTKKNVAKALAIYKKLDGEENKKNEEEENGDWCGFGIESSGDTELWLHADECFNADDVLTYVTKVGRELKLKGKWGFSWANTCSRPRPDGFGGGAAVIDLTTGHQEWINTFSWLEEQLDGE
jgi:hypothetical protein